MFQHILVFKRGRQVIPEVLFVNLGDAQGDVLLARIEFQVIAQELNGVQKIAFGPFLLGFLVIGIGDALAFYVRDSRWTEIVRESLLIGGWVAMWRPLEVFLYDWWPIRAEARLGDRLSEMPVRIVYKADVSSDEWREDWPAVPAVSQSSTTRPASGALARDPISPKSD